MERAPREKHDKKKRFTDGSNWGDCLSVWVKMGKRFCLLPSVCRTISDRDGCLSEDAHLPALIHFIPTQKSFVLFVLGR